MASSHGPRATSPRRPSRSARLISAGRTPPPPSWRAHRRSALPAHARRLRRASATPARLRAAPAHLARRRGPHARGLQRAALTPARARRAGRQRAVPHGARHRPGLDPPDDRGEPAPQGVPPRIPSWEWFAESLAWGQASEHVPDTRRWWFELRLHATYGTLEMRVPDAQATRRRCARRGGVRVRLVEALAARYDAGEPLPVHDSWRIDENRWSAMRDGVEGTLADLDTGERVPTRELLRSRVRRAAPGDRAADAGQRRHPHPAGRAGRRRSRTSSDQFLSV